MAIPEPDEQSPPAPVPRVVRWIAGCALSGGGLALLVVHWTRPQVQFDTAALVLLGLAALPALAVFVKSAKLPGGIEVTLTELRRKTEENRRRTEQVARAQVNSEAVEDRRNQGLLLSLGQIAAPAVPWTARAADPDDAAGVDVPDAALPEPAGTTPRDVAAQRATDRLDALVEQYDRLRRTMASGTERTTLMTRIVSDMTGAVTDGAEVDVGTALGDPSPGRRLSGYATLLVHPDPARLGQLVDNVVDRESRVPFNQYWAIRTLGIVLEAAGRRFDAGQVDRLRALRSTLHDAQDRAYELDRVLRRLDALG